MRKVNGLSLIVGIIFIISSLFSQQEPLKYKIGGSLSNAMENDNADGGMGFSAFIDYPLQNAMIVRTSIGKFSSDTKVDVLSEGDYSQLWIESSLLFTGAQKQKLQPYGGGGVGYYLFNHELSSNTNSYLSSLGFRVVEDIKNIFGLHVRGGANIELTPTLELIADLKYAFLKPKLEGKITDLSNFESVTVKETIEINTLIISIGIRASL